MSNASQDLDVSRGERAHPHQAMSGCLVRFAWSMGGFALLLMLWIAILRESTWTLTWKDALYWAACLGMVAARQVDFSRYASRTPDGDPATQAQVRRYAAGLLGATTVAWGIAQSVLI